MTMNYNALGIQRIIAYSRHCHQGQYLSQAGQSAAPERCVAATPTGMSETGPETRPGDLCHAPSSARAVRNGQRSIGE
jgi:hypothetical protein